MLWVPPPVYSEFRTSTQEVGMFGLGWPEVAIIGIIALVIFGPKKIPEMGSALGKTLRGFKSELNKPTSEEDDTEQDNPKN